MSEADRRKWDARYADGAFEERVHPSAFLLEWGALLPERGMVLDLACGAGRNARHLARRGLTVDAVDISQVALDRGRRESAGLSIRWLRRDLDEGFAPRHRYDAIINFRYVNLPLLRALLRWLRPGGLLLVEQHLVTEAEVVGPKNPAFRVAEGDLSALSANMTRLHLQEGLVDEPDGTRAALARLAAKREGAGQA